MVIFHSYVKLPEGILFDIKINARCDGGDLVIYLKLTLT
jgi:hypothetical protein